MNTAAGKIANPASKVEYPSTFCMNCWPMNMAPISDPNTMIPPTAATQNTRRPAMCRSYSGLAARRWRSTKAMAAATAIAASPKVTAVLPGTGAKLMARISPVTSTADKIPPRLSTGAVDSLTWAGTYKMTMTRAIAANGTVNTKTEPHQKYSSKTPETSGPSAAMALPTPDHRAMARVRAGPAHNAVTRARVVGYAIPADSPPTIRAAIRTPADGANAASRQAGIDNAMPPASRSLRPYRSP